MKHENAAAAPIRLVLLEEGGRLLDASDAIEDADGAELIVVAQGPNDTPAEFASRAMYRLALLERAGKHANEAVVAIGRRSGAAHSAARALLARGLLGHLRQRGAGSLLFSSSERADQALRHELLTLAGDLTAELAGTPVGVRLRFDPASSDERSGVRWKRVDSCFPAAQRAVG